MNPSAAGAGALLTAPADAIPGTRVVSLTGIDKRGGIVGTDDDRVGERKSGTGSAVIRTCASRQACAPRG